ncbi:HlyD family type I secretion periplasmic adaptor subunit [Bradyrhizobium septentrionale]|uniref:HlyD family type I secretion periplasmic adaptor subunit n=1 Tax=Bradyrhizobium septentrionale TaxID=1404411 RepID=UPI001CD5171D|nr:HlyD family type I secretion periplasmic adaptor subunit [Bradyrhizobium septentrionale]UGY22002.1 HlyD family type I secretion periplasmic adaptor subunit [Bradyrhizobium septentrionale]
MTKYYPLIDKAVTALERNTGEARQELYERTRSAFIRHSRNQNPPLTKPELICERLALEEAIQKVEADRSRGDPHQTPPAVPSRPISGGPHHPALPMPAAVMVTRNEPAPAPHSAQATIARRAQAEAYPLSVVRRAKIETTSAAAEVSDPLQVLSLSRRRFSLFGARRQSTPSALPPLDFRSPSTVRKALPKPAAQSIRWTAIPTAMALTVPAINRLFNERRKVDALPAALLEFESPTAALVEAPIKPAARSMLWTVVSAIIASMAVSALFPIDMVVTGSGRVVSLQATNVVQPLETAIVRAINVREGQTVRAGELLARLDPTFSAADVGALQTQVKSFQAEVDRLTAEASGTPYQPTSADTSTVLQVAMYGQRQAQYRYQIESYNQKLSGLQAQITRAEHDVEAFGQRYRIASVLESKRRELERLQVGSQVNRLIAEDQAIEMQRNLTDATGAAERAHRDLDQLIAERDGYEQQWKAKISEELTLRRRSLSDATESLRKATLRRELVDLRADQDAVVLSVAKVSVGSVMQSGEPLITLVPTDAPLEVEMRIATADAGYVHPGQKVAIKFDTFPFVQYGMAEGTVRFISPDSFSGGQDTQRGTVITQSDSAAVFYKARVAIDQLKMYGVPGGFQLKPGMTVTADVKAGMRTLLTYLFARVLPVGLEGMREP